MAHVLGPRQYVQSLAPRWSRSMPKGGRSGKGGCARVPAATVEWHHPAQAGPSQYMVTCKKGGGQVCRTRHESASLPP